QLRYFTTTLRLYDSFPVTDWLTSGDILPAIDALYAVDAIHEAIETLCYARRHTGPVNRPRDEARDPTTPSHSCSLDYTIDYLILALQWPTSSCLKYDNICNVDADYSCWQIHGLWPQRRHEPHQQEVQWCCATAYDPSLLDPIRAELTRKWMTLNVTADNDYFWGHEYDKHGSCGRSSPALADQLRYFTTTLRLYDSFPVTEWLTSGDILPENDALYAVDAIHEAIESKLNSSRVRLNCGDPSGPEWAPILSEIYICLDVDTFQPIDCEGEDNKNTKNLIQYPKH
ncbi:unnamed protein product, partial [Oppiella nova]